MDMSADAAALNALATPAPAGPTPTTAGDGPDGAEAAMSLVDLTVMMIDDEPMLTEVIGTYLEDAGYRNVVGINDATVALEQVRAQNPALVLLDLVMPGVSGFEILQAMRQDERLRYTPVIVLTAASDPDTKLKALSIGATEFLAKPVDPSELVLRVRNSLVLKLYQDRLANSDPVTGLPNRRVLMERLRGNLAQALAGDRKVGLLHVRLDRLQQLQATLGQTAGDELLRAAAQRLRSRTRRDDDGVRATRPDTSLLCRLDGDEFLVLLPNLADPEVCVRVARRVLRSLAEPFQVGNDRIGVSPSIGIAMAPDDGQTPEDLLAIAATAAALACASGRNTYRFGSRQRNQAAMERLKIEAALHHAVERRELRLVYQPKFDPLQGRIVGVEALMRWQQTEMGAIFPDRFIPIAEETGLIVPMGEWALKEACEQCERWARQGLEDLKVAVNVSSQQLTSGQLPALVAALLERHPHMRGALVLELTEGVLIDASPEVNAQLQQFRDQGVQLSIDDFGTGYSSMNYLRQFRLDEIKIDRSFVKDLPAQRSDLSIVRAMTMLGHSLGMRVVAEGVETGEQLACLAEVGVDQIQGYLIGKPMHPDDLAARAAEIAVRGAGQPVPAA
ncbi:MAG: EAL domain-containing protein [Burkholderiaceae bacterium]|jgi:diguanylate cyclase (GGDEF)-like protein|nr:EAL domain-containing protein [Burkholderiaceae bacterium]MCZ8176466.1 EAL domain-containing protein [Burkholderiaceae bacterium]